VLDTHLADRAYLAGDDYTIADMAVWPWYGGLLNGAYNAQIFLNVAEYTHLARWSERVGGREAVKRGRIVNRVAGPGAFLRERHDAGDFDQAEG